METDSPDAAWQTWFNDHGGRLLLCARQWARSAADAEDLVQDAFVRFWRHQRHLPGEPFALVLTSLRRAALDRDRAAGRRTEREIAAVDQPWFAPAPSAAAIAGEVQSELESAVRSLPDEQREVLVLKIWGELTFAEIGAQLDLSPHTAASRYRYALAALRQSLAAADQRPLYSAPCHV